jgi:hypothetical protein
VDWSVKLVEAEFKLSVTAALALTLPAERGQPIGRDLECGLFVSGQARDVAEEGLFVGVERDDRVRGDDLLRFLPQGTGGIEREERLLGHAGEVAQDTARPPLRQYAGDRQPQALLTSDPVWHCALIHQPLVGWGALPYPWVITTSLPPPRAWQHPLLPMKATRRVRFTA